MCTVCFREVEDETHFMLRCPLYEASRVRLADELSRFGVSGEVSQYVEYLRSSGVSGVGVDEVKVMVWLMSGKRAKETASFVKNGFKERELHVQGDIGNI